MSNVRVMRHNKNSYSESSEVSKITTKYLVYTTIEVNKIKYGYCPFTSRGVLTPVLYYDQDTTNQSEINCLVHLFADLKLITLLVVVQRLASEL